MTETQWAQQAQAFIAEHWPDPQQLPQPGSYHLASLRWYAALAECGWSVPHWPLAQGGQRWPKQQLYQWQMFCQQAQTPPLNTLAMSVVAPLLMSDGSAQQQAYWLAEIADFAAHWALALLEPVNAKTAPPTRLQQGDNGLVLVGEKRAMADGLLASTELAKDALWPSRLLCLALDSTDTWTACALGADSPGLSMAPVANARGRWFHVEFDAVAVADADILPLRGDGLLAALADPAAGQDTILPSASSHGIAQQLELLREDLLVAPHEDSVDLLKQLSAAEVALQGLQALEIRAMAPRSAQLPEPLPMSVLQLKAQALQEQIGTLQLASFGYYALPQAAGLSGHNEGPIDPRGNAARDTALQTSEALAALAASGYGWDPRDLLARHWLGLGSGTNRHEG
jgi:hypothetical protein